MFKASCLLIVGGFFFAVGQGKIGAIFFLLAAFQPTYVPPKPKPPKPVKTRADEIKRRRAIIHGARRINNKLRP